MRFLGFCWFLRFLYQIDLGGFWKTAGGHKNFRVSRSQVQAQVSNLKFCGFFQFFFWGFLGVDRNPNLNATSGLLMLLLSMTCSGIAGKEISRQNFQCQIASSAQPICCLEPLLRHKIHCQWPPLTFFLRDRRSQTIFNLLTISQCIFSPGPHCEESLLCLSFLVGTSIHGYSFLPGPFQQKSQIVLATPFYTTYRPRVTWTYTDFHQLESIFFYMFSATE